MTSLRPLRRLTAIFAAALLLLSRAGDGAGVHPCKHHGAAAVEQAAGAAHHGGHGEHGPAHDSSNPCTCEGTCAAPAGIALPPASIVHAQAVEIQAPLALHSAAEHAPARVIAHLLPYAQAPPPVG